MNTFYLLLRVVGLIAVVCSSFWMGVLVGSVYAVNHPKHHDKPESY